MHSQMPSFSIRRRLFSGKWTVIARWADGTRLLIRGFDTRQVAEYWLESEARNWLTQRHFLRAALAR